MMARLKCNGRRPAPPCVSGGGSAALVPTVGMPAVVFTPACGTPGTVVHVTPGKRRIHVQLEGKKKIKVYTLRVNGRWVPLGKALDARLGTWLVLNMRV
jgi:hypothetical protein